MKLAGSRSWRFAVEVSDLLHLALRIRDGAALDVPTSAHVPTGTDVPTAFDVPPPLSAPPEATPASIDQTAAGAQWLPWWRELLDLEGRRHLLRPDQVTERWGTLTRRLHAEVQAIADPPRFEALRHRPALQAAARAVGPGPRRSVDRALQAARGGRDVIDWTIVNSAVHAVAAETGAELNSLNGCALVLLVQGSWWQSVSPGVVLASLDAAADPSVADALVQAALRSGL